MNGIESTYAPARNAVDGNIAPDQKYAALSAPGHTGNAAWWMVQLGKLHQIERVVLYNTDSTVSGYIHK